VDLFILTGELGITISTLRDGAHDWRAWVYFAAGCGPSVTFNVLHVFVALPRWATYAVAATPPIAALLALAALMQQVLGLPEALRQWHDRQQQDEPSVISQPVPNAAEIAAEASLRATLAAGNPLSQNQLVTQFRLTRAEATKLRTRVLAESNGHTAHTDDEVPPETP
jgi:endonuclease/exonuclease/phosphatase (EEP) superfamily protein YafD